MAVNLTINGTAYSFPQTGDETWGTNVTNWATAVSSYLLQRTGGSFPLSADLDFGASFGILSVYFKSRSANIAQAGIFRLASQDKISFRNNANSADLPLSTDASDNLTYNGNAIFNSSGVASVSGGGTGISSYTAGDMLYASGTTTLSKLAIGTANFVQVSTGSAPSWALLVNANISASAAIAYSKLTLTNSVVNADISSSAAIAYSKLSLTNSIVNADIATAAAIAYSKLNLSGSIVNADISASAAIALSKTDKTFNTEAIFAQISTPSNPSAGNNKIYPKSDGYFYSLDSSGAERKIGSGAGSINYIQSNPDAESGTTGWATYKNTAQSTPVSGTGGSPTHITLTSSGTTPLRGTKSFLMSNSGSTSAQGEGVSFDFTIDPADQAKVLAFTFDYKIASGTFVSGNSSDVQAFIYDKTNTILIPVTPFTIQGGGTSLYWNFKGVFQTNSNSTSYRLILHVASTNTSAYGFEFDNVFVGPQSVSYGPPVTDWTSFTPTGSWSTNTTYTGLYRRVGGDMELEIALTFAGAPSSGNLTINIPSGYTIDTTRFPGNQVGGTSVYLGNGAAYIPSSVYNVTVAYNSTGSVLLGYTTGTGNGNVTPTTPATFTASSALNINFRVPIVGWSSTLLMSNDTDTRVVAMSVLCSGGTLTTTSANNFTWGTPVFDTHGAFSGTTYTVPVSGIYKVSGQAGGGGAGSYGTAVNVAKNGVAQSPTFVGSPNAVNSALCPFSYIGKFNAGDTIQVWGNVTTGTQSAATVGVWNVERMTGPSAIASTELVACGYELATATGLLNNTEGVVIFSTKDFDTHGAYNTSTGVFTCPVGGIYEVQAMVQFAASGTGIRQVFVQKNAVAQYRNLDSDVAPSASIADVVGGMSLFNCNAGDTLAVSVLQSSGGTINICPGNSGAYNYMNIQRISR